MELTHSSSMSCIIRKSSAEADTPVAQYTARGIVSAPKYSYDPASTRVAAKSPSEKIPSSESKVALIQPSSFAYDAIGVEYGISSITLKLSITGYLKFEY